MTSNTKPIFVVKKTCFSVFVLIFIFKTNALFGQISGLPGAYSRLGVSPKSIAMGNATSASIHRHTLHAYHNPALLAFSDSYQGGISFSSLSLDRSYNTLFMQGPIGPDAGLGFSWIHAGVDNIDGRDSDGNPTETYSTSENLFLVSFAKTFGESFAAGLSLRAYHAGLFKEISSSFSVGFDLGVLKTFMLEEEHRLSFAIIIKDIRSKYEWDTTPIYNEEGSTSTDKLPVSYNFGVSYFHNNILSLNALQVVGELSHQTATVEGRRSITRIIDGFPVTSIETVDLERSQTFLRMGLLLQPVSYFSVQLGVDQLGLSGWAFTEIAKPALGFSFMAPFQNLDFSFDYAYIFENHSNAGINSLALTVKL